MKGKTGKEKWKRLWAGILVLVLLCGNPVLAAEQEEAASPGLQDIYYEWQTEEEILALCDQGLDLEDFSVYHLELPDEGRFGDAYRTGEDVGRHVCFNANGIERGR